MSDQKGLYGKYRIAKADTGEPIEGFAFVLKPESDWRAALALRFYAALTQNSNALLADDLQTQLGKESVEPFSALEKLAVWFEQETEFWGKHEGEFYRGMGKGYESAAEQLRGLLYEVSNPAPTGPWDSYDHMQDEMTGWMEDHPLTERDEEGHSTTSGAFYK